MTKLALNFICKNESHVILNMLHSVQPITDLIVAVDTGSSDATIRLVKEFGSRYSIPTYVHERMFDNFGSSRNFALDQLKKAVTTMSWKAEECWGFWIDCDETLVLSSEFNKESLTADMYQVRTVEGSISYTKSLFFRLSKNFYWEGPVHEILRWDETNVSVELVRGVHIVYERAGASWKGDLVKKYLFYAKELEKFVEAGNQGYRWVFNTGESYNAAAESCTSPEQQSALREKAIHYYERAGLIKGRRKEDQFLVQYRLAETKQAISREWQEVEPHYLLAYELRWTRAEPLNSIIQHYLREGNFTMAYLFAWFGKHTFHGHNPFSAENYIMVDEGIYQWRMLFNYYLACRLSRRYKEAKACYRELRRLLKDKVHSFSEADRVRIYANGPVLLRIHSILNQIRKHFGLTSKPIFSHASK